MRRGGIRLRVLVTVCAAAAAGAASYAAAATLGVSSGSLGAGEAPVVPCDGNGFTYTRTLDAIHDVASVTVSGIDAACAGGTLQLTLANASGNVLGSGSAQVGTSGYVTVAISGLAPAANLAAYDVAITS